MRENSMNTTNKRATITGQGACIGQALGEARIIDDVSTIHDFEDGEILVTTMTTPEMVGAMKRAAAVICSEGGSKSHAAVMASRIGVPCIVGTGQAGKSIHTGDQLYVNVEGLANATASIRVDNSEGESLQ